jgi:hypothetical protein
MKADPKVVEAFLKQVPADEYPYFLEHADEHMTPVKRDGVSEFEFGLDLILDGVEKIREARERTSRRPRVEPA